MMRSLTIRIKKCKPTWEYLRRRSARLILRNDISVIFLVHLITCHNCCVIRMPMRLYPITTSPNPKVLLRINVKTFAIAVVIRLRSLSDCFRGYCGRQPNYEEFRGYVAFCVDPMNPRVGNVEPPIAL